MENLSLEQRVVLLEMTVENQSKLIDTLHGMIKTQQESLQNVYKIINDALELMKIDSDKKLEKEVDPNKRIS